MAINYERMQRSSPLEGRYAAFIPAVGAFFGGDPRREIDVLTCHVFGYGRAD